jgi:uncharacterized protein YegL
MRNDYIHITLVCDKSGSMYTSKDDVIGGVKKIIDEQKANKEGKCTVSLYTFNEKVKEVFVGKDVNDIEEFKYNPDGLTAMNDGLGVAIDNTGKWLAAMDEEDRPGKVLVAVFTDGLENASKEYTLKQVQDKIKEQTDKYSWEFIYMGTDITTSKAADDLGFKFKTYGSRKKFANNYDIINSATTAYRSMAKTSASLADTSALFCATLDEAATKNTADYEAEIGKKITNT